MVSFMGLSLVSIFVYIVGYVYFAIVLQSIAKENFAKVA